MQKVHGDDKGLVLPPRVAPKQVVFVPVPSAKGGGTLEDLVALLSEAQSILEASGVRCEMDASTHHTAGWKFNHWELKGVPLRIEAGPRELEAQNVRLVRRDTGHKSDVGVKQVGEAVLSLLDTIQREMLVRARRERDDKIVTALTWGDFMKALGGGCMVLAPFCCRPEWEKHVGAQSSGGSPEEDSQFGMTGSAKALCVPFDQPEMPAGLKCFVSGERAERWVLFGRSY